MSNYKTISRRIAREVRAAKALLADPRVPRPARWLLAAAVAYALSPIDLIPDFIPVIGWLDDLAVVPLLVWLALRLVPADALADARAAADRDAG